MRRLGQQHAGRQARVRLPGLKKNGRAHYGHVLPKGPRGQREKHVRKETSREESEGTRTRDEAQLRLLGVV